MKLEYIPDGELDTPLIRIYDFQPADAVRLRGLMNDLASGETDSVQLHEMAGLTSMNDCRLTLKLGSRDQGVFQSHQRGMATCWRFD